ncbi:MFS transporter [Filobacillus milosensis]|nr:MFS transporter [Filobacillus milosensis]
MLKWIVISQSLLLFGTGLVFPFYIIFLSEVGGNFSEFGIAYGIFTISSALVHHWVGRRSDKVGRKSFLLINTWGSALIYLTFPIITSIGQVYIIQVLLGILGAMQKTSEKAIVADFTDGESRGKKIGSYHFWVSLFSGFAVIVGGFLIDLLTVDIIFYFGSIILFVSGWFILFINESRDVN